MFLFWQAASNVAKKPSTSSGQKLGIVWEMELISAAAGCSVAAAAATRDRSKSLPSINGFKLPGRNLPSWKARLRQFNKVAEEDEEEDVEDDTVNG